MKTKKTFEWNFKNLFFTLAFTILILSIKINAQAYTIGGVVYSVCSSTETVVADFKSAAGALTTGNYSGMVLITCSGTGASLGSSKGDAFYFNIPGSPTHHANHYQLVTTIEGTVHHSTGNDDDAYRHIYYNVDAGIEVTAPYTPPYQASNKYTFIIDMNTLIPSNPNPVPLRVGVNDGIYSDNFCNGCDNFYTVKVTQLCACGDADGDGYADADCGGDDCDDANEDINPGVVESCNGHDDDCDDLVDEGFDADGDGTADCFDGCPNDANKIEPGICGCGVVDTDSDGDGVANCIDNCMNTANVNQEDSDCDGVGDACDLCPGGNDKIDNNNDGQPDCHVYPGFSNLPASWKCGNKNDKVSICHNVGYNPHTICVAQSAVADHLAHGDYLGPCDEASCNSSLKADGSKKVYSEIMFNDSESNIDNIHIYPNPSQDEFYVHCEYSHDCNFELQVIDALGTVIQYLKITNDSQVSFGENYPDGLYYASVKYKSYTETIKLVKQGRN
ncbi:MAG: T9SS type A sorting domain-containing protein [Saprospiraceae bacterium]|nr:T9SS type A sorting domain-containing protein [Saprospiraceae bacterium]